MTETVAPEQDPRAGRVIRAGAADDDDRGPDHGG